MIYSENERVQETAEFLFPSAFKANSRTISSHSNMRFGEPYPEVHEKIQDTYEVGFGFYVTHTYTKTTSYSAAYRHDGVYELRNNLGEVIYTERDDPGNIYAEQFKKYFTDIR